MNTERYIAPINSTKNKTMQKGTEQKLIEIKFEGIDSWNRPIFKDTKSNRRYGSGDVLLGEIKRVYPNGTNAEIVEYFKNDNNIRYLCYFGRSFDCEPMGTTPEKELIII